MSLVIPTCHCPHCNTIINRSTQTTSNVPKPGDITMCSHCGGWGVFDANIMFSIPPPDERKRIMDGYGDMIRDAQLIIASNPTPFRA